MLDNFHDKKAYVTGGPPDFATYVADHGLLFERIDAAPTKMKTCILASLVASAAAFAPAAGVRL